MKRLIRALIIFVLFVAATATALKVSIDKISGFALEKNVEKTALVEQRLQRTFSLLEELSHSEYILSKDISFEEKAIFLAEKNTEENLGYMMIRILDSEINIYNETVGLASSLASRDYMQRMYATGENQLTDAFLAGKDGTTINYTATTAIMEDGVVTGALMAAMYDSEINGYLQDDCSVNVLLGSERQYMSGIPAEEFGTPILLALETYKKTSRPVENILLDFEEKKSGEFWLFGEGIQYCVYSPVNLSEWVVMTQVHIWDLTKNIRLIYSACIIVLIAAAIILLRKPRDMIKMDQNEDDIMK